MRHQSAPHPVCCLARDISYLPFPSYLEDPRTAIAWRGAVSQSFLLTKLLQPASWRTGHPAVGRDGVSFSSGAWVRYGMRASPDKIHHPPGCQQGLLTQLPNKLHLARAGIITKGPERSGQR